tara:strand:- start:1711 stop:1887 length:177 start_codon:yes stop_codon:yes gene_type:complete
MRKYKYYHKTDLNKETVGTVKANSLGEARSKALIKKQLNFSEFNKLFNVEEIINERKN